MPNRWSYKKAINTRTRNKNSLALFAFWWIQFAALLEMSFFRKEIGKNEAEILSESFDDNLLGIPTETKDCPKTCGPRRMFYRYLRDSWCVRWWLCHSLSFTVPIFVFANFPPILHQGAVDLFQTGSDQPFLKILVIRPTEAWLHWNKYISIRKPSLRKY